MSEPNIQNPFFILGLPTDATKGDITQRAEELYQTDTIEEKRQSYQWAKEQLITNPRTRLIHELYEMPNTSYDNLEWENFLRKYRHVPVSPEKLSNNAHPISSEQINMEVLLQLLIDVLVNTPDADAATMNKASSSPSKLTSTLEVHDVLFG